MNPNGPHEDQSFYVDIATSDYSEDEVMSNVECVYCYRITGSSPCLCLQEEDSDMRIESDYSASDSEDENVLNSESVILHHFERPDLQVMRIDYGLPPAPPLKRLQTYCPQTTSGGCLCILSENEDD